MLKPDIGLYEATIRRVSRRKYLKRPVPAQSLEELKQLAERFQTEEPRIRIVIGPEGAERLFESRNGYGMATGAISYAAFIAKDNQVESALRTGYYGEWLILAATKLGLGTCWMAGTFQRPAAESLLSLQAGEELLCVTPLGEAVQEKSFKERAIATVMGSRKRKPLEALCTGMDTTLMPEWMKTALECARNAPSGVNLQPWRFTGNGDRVRIRLAEGKSGHGTSFIDCGISMLHFSIGARQAGVAGVWTAAPDPFLAEFVPDASGLGIGNK